MQYLVYDMDYNYIHAKNIACKYSRMINLK